MKRVLFNLMARSSLLSKTVLMAYVRLKGKFSVSAQRELLSRMRNGSIAAKEVLSAYAQNNKLSEDIYAELVKLSYIGSPDADEILAAHAKKYEHSRKTADDLAKFIVHDLHIASIRRYTMLWELP